MAVPVSFSVLIWALFVDACLGIGMRRKQAVRLGATQPLVALHQLPEEGAKSGRVVAALVGEPQTLLIGIVLVAAIESRSTMLS